MKKSSMSFALRIISLLLGIVGILLVLRSTELGLAQADSLTSAEDEYGSGTRFWLVQQSGIAAYRTLGAILAGVGLFHALRPLSRLEMQKISMAAEAEPGIHRTTSPGLTEDDVPGASFGMQHQQPRTDSASRTIQASPQKLYWAFVDPDVLVRWLPPEGMRGKVELFEPQAGGAYRMVLTHTGSSGSFAGKTSADTDVVEGRFVELAPGERIVQAIRFDSPDPAFAGEMRMTWNLQADGGGTQVTVVCEQVPSGIGQKEHEQALASTLRNLERIVS